MNGETIPEKCRECKICKILLYALPHDKWQQQLAWCENVRKCEPIYSTVKMEPEAKNDAKHDAGKPLAGQMVNDFANALQAVADVTTFGTKKYAAGSWRTIPDAEIRYRDALYRHLLADAAGQSVDTESGLPHLAHAAWNVLALLELQATKP